MNGTTYTLKGSRVLLDEENQTLDVAFEAMSVVANDAKDKIDNLEIGGVNLLSVKAITREKYLNSSGNTVNHVDWFFSDYIYIRNITHLTTSGYSNLGNAPSFCFYDANNTFVRGVTIAGGNISKLI